MRTVASQIIAGFKAKGRCDAVEEFARVYPILIFIEFFGLPPDRGEQFRAHAHRFLHTLEPVAWAAIREIVKEQLERKRVLPAEDLLTAIANGKISGEPISLDTAVNVAATVFLGGLDTLPSNIGWMLRHLAIDTDLRRRLVSDRSLIPAAVEEFLRYYSVANPVRRVKRDMQFHGATMKAEDRVFVAISCANRDPSEFGQGVRLDREVNRHLTFASGPHRCLGSHIARHELGVAMDEWLRAIPDFRVQPGARPQFQGPILSMNNLELEWD